MNTTKTIQSALISVFSKEGLEPIIKKLHEQNVVFYSTGGTEEFIKNLVFEKEFNLENGKTISRIWVEKLGLSVSNRNYWDEIFDFYNEKMNALELFYAEYDEFIKDIE